MSAAYVEDANSDGEVTRPSTRVTASAKSRRQSISMRVDTRPQRHHDEFSDSGYSSQTVATLQSSDYSHPSDRPSAVAGKSHSRSQSRARQPYAFTMPSPAKPSATAKPTKTSKKSSVDETSSSSKSKSRPQSMQAHKSNCDCTVCKKVKRQSLPTSHARAPPSPSKSKPKSPVAGNLPKDRTSTINHDKSQQPVTSHPLAAPPSAFRRPSVAGSRPQSFHAGVTPSMAYPAPITTQWAMPPTPMSHYFPSSAASYNQSYYTSAPTTPGAPYGYAASLQYPQTPPVTATLHKPLPSPRITSDPTLKVSSTGWHSRPRSPTAPLPEAPSAPSARGRDAVYEEAMRAAADSAAMPPPTIPLARRLSTREPSRIQAASQLSRTPSIRSATPSISGATLAPSIARRPSTTTRPQLATRGQTMDPRMYQRESGTRSKRSSTYSDAIESSDEEDEVSYPPPRLTKKALRSAQEEAQLRPRTSGTESTPSYNMGSDARSVHRLSREFEGMRIQISTQSGEMMSIEAPLAPNQMLNIISGQEGQPARVWTEQTGTIEAYKAIEARTRAGTSRDGDTRSQKSHRSARSRKEDSYRL